MFTSAGSVYAENSGGTVDESKLYIYTVCPRSLDPFHVLCYYIYQMVQNILDIRYRDKDLVVFSEWGKFGLNTRVSYVLLFFFITFIFID